MRIPNIDGDWELYLCRSSTGRRISFGEAGDSVFPSREAFSVRGPLLGFGTQYDDGAVVIEAVVIVDLRRPSRLLYSAHAHPVARVTVLNRRTVVWADCIGGDPAHDDRWRCREGSSGEVRIMKIDAASPVGPGLGPGRRRIGQVL
jgi:hypothetical protein